MAIKRLDPKAIFKVISTYDQALDNETAQELLDNQSDLQNLKVTRYEEYIGEANFDESKLKFKEGLKPDYILLKALSADDLADINGRYVLIDVVQKKTIITNRNKMYIEMFKAAYQGIESEGKASKVPLDEIEYQIQIEMGAIASLIASLGKNLKKQ